MSGGIDTQGGAMNIASIVYHAQGKARLGVKTRYQKRVAISGRKGKHAPCAVCEKCGRIGSIHLHHRDYTKPDLVMNLCAYCHPTQQAADRNAGLDCSLSGRL